MRYGTSLWLYFEQKSTDDYDLSSRTIANIFRALAEGSGSGCHSGYTSKQYLVISSVEYLEHLSGARRGVVLVVTRAMNTFKLFQGSCTMLYLSCLAALLSDSVLFLLVE